MSFEGGVASFPPFLSGTVNDRSSTAPRRLTLQAEHSHAVCSEGVVSIMEPVQICHSSHEFATQSSHSVDLAGWQAKMASIEIWIP